MKRCLLGVCTVLAIGSACKKKEEDKAAKPGPSPVANPSPSPDPGPTPNPGPTWKQGDKVDHAVLEQLGRAVASCALRGEGETGLDSGCAAYTTFQQAMGSLAMLDAQAAGDAVGRKLIADEHPPVRALAAQYLASITGTDTGSGDVIAAAMASEQDARVLATMVRMAQPVASRSPKVAEAIVAASRHADRWVRFHATVVLGARGLAGGAARLAELVDTDDDAKVRDLACKQLGALGDDAALPLLDKHTAAPTDPVYAACMEGLVAMWNHYPRFDTASKAAFDLTLKRLAATPRAEMVPPFTIFGHMGKLGPSATGDAAAWKTANPWWKPAPLVAALGAVVSDLECGYTPKSAALRAAVELGADPATVGKWRKAYGDAPAPKHTSIVKALDAAIAK